MWASAIFFGPSLITSVTSYLSGGKVNLTRVKVSPNLKISSSVVDIILPFSAGGRDLSSTSRAFSINWEIENGFEIVGNIGPSKLQKYGTLASADFRLKPISLFDWSEIYLQLELKQLKGPGFQFLRGDFNGTFTEAFQNLKDAELEISKVHGEVLSKISKADSLSFTLDLYKIAEPLIQQNSQLTYRFQNFLMPEIAFDLSELHGGIKLSEGEGSFSLSATEARLGEKFLKAESITLSSRSLPPFNYLKSSWDFSISEVVSQNPAVVIKNYSGSVTPTSLGVSHSGKAVISRLELEVDQYVLGEIEDAIFDVDISSNVLTSEASIKGRGALTLNQVEDFSATFSFEALLPEVNISECFDRTCKISDLEADYRIKSSGSSLEGNLKCDKTDCLSGAAQHVMQTDNTNKFFQGLLNANILNSISMPIAYFAISGGEVVGEGHVLNF